jgi:DNA repair protein RadC
VRIGTDLFHGGNTNVFGFILGDQVPIKDWPASERPREKLLALGAQALSEAELLAIFLRTGIAGRDVLEIARDALHRFNGLNGLRIQPVDATH